MNFEIGDKVKYHVIEGNRDFFIKGIIIESGRDYAIMITIGNENQQHDELKLYICDENKSDFYRC